MCLTSPVSLSVFARRPHAPLSTLIRRLSCYGSGGTLVRALRDFVPLPVGLRLDRLLATELRISLSLLQALHDGEKLRTDPGHKDMLRRRIKHGLRIALDLSGEADLQDVWKAAVEGPATITPQMRRF